MKGLLHISSATPSTFAKTVGALVLGGIALYCLHTGQRDRDMGRLVWAAVLALGSLFVFAL